MKQNCYANLGYLFEYEGVLEPEKYCLFWEKRRNWIGRRKEGDGYRLVQ